MTICAFLFALSILCSFAVVWGINGLPVSLFASAYSFEPQTPQNISLMYLIMKLDFF